MKILKILLFYFLFIVLVFLSWVVIALITVSMGEVIGIKPGSVILGALGLYSIKWAKGRAKKLAKHGKRRKIKND